MVCPELTEQIRREVAASLHQRKGDFTCYFLTDLVTFTLPAGQFGHGAAETQTLVTHGNMTPGRLVSSCSKVNKSRCMKIHKLFVRGLCGTDAQY